jgi:hypothetical protein
MLSGCYGTNSEYTLVCFLRLILELNLKIMKKLMIILFATGLALGASAQRYGHGGGVYYARPRVVISSGFYSPFYPYYGYGYPFFPYPSYGYNQRPTRMDLKIEDIKNDYQDKIWAAKHDKSISRKERKRTVHELKHERDEAIIQAKRDYYKPKARPGN